MAAIDVARTIARSEAAVIAYQDLDTKVIARDLGLSLPSALLVAGLGAAVTAAAAPTVPVATIVSKTQVAITFTPGAANGDTFTGQYEVTSSPGAFVDILDGPGDLATMPFVTATGYTFTVKAVNAAGKSVASVATASVTPNP